MWVKGAELVMEKENWIKCIQWWKIDFLQFWSLKMILKKENVVFCKKAEDLDGLMVLIKKKVTSAKTEEKAKLQTLVPDSWTLKEIEEFFHVSNRIARNSRVLKNEKGLLPKVESRNRKVLLEEIRDRVINCYQSDKFSRICSGKKEFVSVKIDDVKQHMQKHLLLINLTISIFKNFRKILNF